MYSLNSHDFVHFFKSHFRGTVKITNTSSILMFSFHNQPTHFCIDGLHLNSMAFKNYNFKCPAFRQKTQTINIGPTWLLFLMLLSLYKEVVSLYHKI